MEAIVLAPLLSYENKQFSKIKDIHPPTVAVTGATVGTNAHAFVNKISHFGK
jgi:hypothetical protein